MYSTSASLILSSTSSAIYISKRHISGRIHPRTALYNKPVEGLYDKEQVWTMGTIFGINIYYIVNSAEVLRGLI